VAHTPFPNFAAAAHRALAPGRVESSLSDQLLTLLEREPEVVAEQVRAWLMEDDA
jgi:flagellar biosynthesis/type III secretory pathway M-ring protein FliF/YscJ